MREVERLEAVLERILDHDDDMGDVLLEDHDADGLELTIGHETYHELRNAWEDYKAARAAGQGEGGTKG